jgi:uncharacterized membrane protein
MKPAWSMLGRIFFTGLLTVLPVLITLYFTIWVLGAAERFFGKQLMLVIPDEYYRTGMGLVVAIAVVFAVGLLMHGLIFRRVFRTAERVLLEIPFVRSVYAALRDLFGLFADHKESSMQVVAVTLPGELRLLGFATRQEFGDLPAGVAREGEVAVYLPMSYQIGGYMVFVPREKIQPIAMSREEAMKFILTAGLKAVPQKDAAPRTRRAGARAPARTRLS